MSQRLFKTPIKPAAGNRLQAGARIFSPLKDACCAPVVAPSAPAAPVRRTRLADVDPNIHCSIIGTCLTTAELRKLIPRHAPLLDRERASDLEIHHTAVALSIDGGVVAKELGKALDTRHASAVKRFRAAPDDDAVRALWRAALADGDVPGAYWALMTHPCASFELRQLAFGDVHMLSHLVGASNRADIRRLVALEDECGILKQKNESQQTRLNDIGAQHARAMRELRQQVADLTAERNRQFAAAPKALADEVQMLRNALDDREQKLALHTARRNDAELRLHEQQESAKTLRIERDNLQAAADAAHAETLAVEQALSLAVGADAGSRPLPFLQDKCVMYVGGRPDTNAMLARLVAAAGGELLIHDGGIEDRKRLLDTMLPRAHLVVFPVDCISHDAMHSAKRLCDRHAIAYHPLRTASMASFIEAIDRLTAHEQARQAPISHFCLRHG